MEGSTMKFINWLEQWAKAGAGPNFRVENPKEYIENFNWLQDGLSNYFMEKSRSIINIIICLEFNNFLFFKKFKIKIKPK
jgi:hypothetical protein